LKHNYNKNIEKGIKKTTLLSSTIIIILVATIIGTVLTKIEYSNFRTHIKNFRNTLIGREKFYIKTAVENLKSDIEFEKISLLNSKKQRIKNQSIIAYNLAHSLYKKTKNETKKEQIQLIKSSIKQISQIKNDINYFIFDEEGNLLLNTENPKNEGVNFLDFEDINGVKFTNQILNASKNRQNYIEYFWYKPNKKITYSRHLKELGIIIGSGSFLESSNAELKEKLLQKIYNQNFNEEEYLFIYKIKSLNNIKTQSELLIEKHLNTSRYDLEAVKKLMIQTNYKGNDYIFYNSYQNLVYGTFLVRLRYFIAVGVNLSHINKIVEKEKAISLDNMYSKIAKLVIIITIITIIFFLLSILFTKKIARIFKQYKHNVILNEEKYSLLFNHSNDAFIISKIHNTYANIISCNKTALKVSSYKEDELIGKDFFSLFVDLDLDTILKNKSLIKTVELTNKNGEIRTIELNIITNSVDKKDLLFASLRDITERTLLRIEKNRQENILIQKSKMAAMGEMIGNIAHQWRQPLSQVSGLFFDIESAYEYNELNKKYLKDRVEEANDLLEYMSKTIDDFRNFFKPNSIKDNFLVIDSVNSALKIVNSTLSFHKIQIDISDNLEYKIHGYKNEYSQAIVNIISNAKDILIDRKIVNPCIKIYMTDNNSTLCIEDNAGGVDKDIINKIFDPYFTTKFDYGTGIGLYMTKLIIEEKMNGLIKVENKEHGAVFSIKI
jgi:PAS domain S-box-containing protein